MRRVLALAVALTLGGVAGWVVYTWPTTVQYLPYFSVTYSKGIGKELVVEVVNETGHPVVFCATLYGWLPNGTFQKIGWKCGKGAISLDKKPLDDYVKHFVDKPGEVGIIVLLTYVNGTEGGKPILARHVSGFTVSPKDAFANDRVKATIKVKSRGGGGKSGGSQAKFASLQWPPSRIDEGCYAADTWYVCYWWELDYIYTSGSGGIPMAAVRVPFDYDKIYTVFVKAYLSVYQSNYIYFRGGAAIKYKNITRSFSGDIVSHTLKETRVYLDIRRTEYAYKINKPFILAVGLYVDYVVARYKEMQYDPTGTRPTGYTADMYLVRPWFNSDGTVVPYSEIDYTIYDDSGASGFTVTAVAYWSSYRLDADGANLFVDSITVKQSASSIDLFSVGIPLPQQAAKYVSASVTAGVGQIQQVTALAVVQAMLREDYTNTYYLFGYYYKPSVQYYVDNQLVGVPALYLSAYVVRK